MAVAYAGIDFSKLVARGKEKNPLQAVEHRVEAKIARFSKLTVDDRLEGFSRIGFHPHGLYIPNDEEVQAVLKRKVQAVGAVSDPEERIRRYLRLQAITMGWFRDGMAGKWIGQMAVAMSRARFRVVAWGRRGGKTFYAAREALVVGIMKPRSVIWVCAPTMKLVGRCFTMILNLVRDLGIGIVKVNDTGQSKLLILENGSTFEGVSFEEGAESPGTGVDLAVVDEAARIEDEEVFDRELLPVLTEREGDAIFISSWEGDENVFNKMVEKAQDSGDVEDWEMFQGETWQNFFEFPEGLKSKKIQVIKRTMDPVNFLEEFGAIAKKNKDLVFGKEFKRRVHIGHFPFQKGQNVRLAVDPSSGGDPYAVRVLQDYGNYYIQIDEFYERGPTVEQVSAILDKRNWRDNVTDVVIDNNWPHEVERWAKLGWPAYPVPDKPQIKDRIPIHRRLLRNPEKFWELYMVKAERIMAEADIRPDSYYDLSPQQQYAIALQVEESLADHNLTQADIEFLKSCARVRIDERCVWTIKEYEKYKYKNKAKETFADDWNHLMDCGGYYDWVFYRTEGDDIDRETSYLPVVPEFEEYRASQEDETAPDSKLLLLPGRGFLGHMRELHARQSGGCSYLKAVG